MAETGAATVPLDVLLSMSTAAVALVNADGSIERATPAFTRLATGRAPPRAGTWSMEEALLQPRWRDLASTPPRYGAQGWRRVHEGLLNFGADDEARSAEGVVLTDGERFAVLAGADPAAHAVPALVMRLNEELQDAHRAQMRTIRTLRRTEEELRRALADVRTLRGLLPICAHCKKVKSDEGYWERLDSYVARHTEAQFSHGLCDVCLAEATRGSRD